MDPRITIDVLVELGRREEELAEARASADRERRQSRDRRELAAEYDEDATGAEEAGRVAGRDFRRHDRELREAERLLAAKRGQLVGLTDRRQHRALGEEITALERRLEQLELAGLQALETAEASDREAVAAHREAERLAAATPPPDPAAAARAAAAAQERERDIERLTGMLPPDVARHVARLRRRGERAVVWLDEGACGGCHALLPAQQAIAVGRGRELVRCASCARYIVHRPWR